MMRLVLITIALSLGSLAHAIGSEQFEQIQSIEFTEIYEDENGVSQERLIVQSYATDPAERFSISDDIVRVGSGDIIMKTKRIIALGKEIYKIVEAGRPVVNVKSNPIEILPVVNNVAVPSVELSGWKRPKTKKYKIEMKNYLGMSPVIFEFMLIFSYGGSYDGEGAFITGAQLKPTRVSVKWGYEFNALFNLQTIVNEGSQADPIVGAVLMMDGQVKTTLQEERLSKTLYINGLGDVEAY